MASFIGIDHLQRFCELKQVTNFVHAYIDGQYISIPANFYSLDALYGKEKSKVLQEKLIEYYGYGSEVHILTMLNSKDDDIQKLAGNLYQKIFVGYNAKMWGLKPEELDSTVKSRSISCLFLPMRVNLLPPSMMLTSSMA